MNLQFFAEEDGADVNEVEAVEQPEGEVAEATSEEPDEPQFQTEKANAAFASMRRELEASRRQQQEIDAMYARQYGQYTNPETGQPIRSARDYFEAMAAQERVTARAQMQEKGIDPSVIDSMIANSPAVRQAQAVTSELNNYRAQQMMNEDFNKVLQLDPTLKSAEDIVNDSSYAQVVEYCQRVPGMRFSEAYKLVNFDKLSGLKGEAAKQATINSVKSKNHLSTGSALNVPDSDEDIPASSLDSWKETFPEKSMKELKALYNKAVKNGG